jgi:hypothetical protein
MSIFVFGVIFFVASFTKHNAVINCGRAAASKQNFVMSLEFF